MKTTKLQALGACESGLKWARTQRSYADAWANCQRGDWMIWVLGHTLPLDDLVRLLYACLVEAEDPIAAAAVITDLAACHDVPVQAAIVLEVADGETNDDWFAKCADIIRQHYPEVPHV